MNTQTEEFLWLLLWTMDSLSRPTLNNITDSFEGWAYCNGLARRLEYLERQKLLERHTDSLGEHLYRLTETGRLQALGGRDPETKWGRAWDGHWRLVFFDLPEERNTLRVRLRRLLRAKGFGCLQRSVWISPDPLDEVMTDLAQFNDDAGSLVSFDARPAKTFPDATIVSTAWNFTELNRRYGQCLEIIQQRPASGNGADIKEFTVWYKQLHHAWVAAFDMDPLLPARLLPANYLGKMVWQKRKEIFAKLPFQR